MSPAKRRTSTILVVAGALATCALVLIFALGMVLVLYGPWSPGGDAPTGIYVCTANEFGMLAGTGWYEIAPGGRITDKIADETGRWTYDSATQTFAFTGGLGLDSGLWQPQYKEVLN